MGPRDDPRAPRLVCVVRVLAAGFRPRRCLSSGVRPLCCIVRSHSYVAQNVELDRQPFSERGPGVV